MSRTQIFVSYDDVHDQDLRDLLEVQSKRPGSCFELTGCSHGGAISPAWTTSVRNRIRAADEMIVICGENTGDSPRAAAEMQIALEEGTPYFLLWGRRKQMCTKPEGAKRDDGIYSWTQDILESQIQATLRASHPPDVPESLKRRPS